jgi:hypothetical protein
MPTGDQGRRAACHMTAPAPGHSRAAVTAAAAE